MNIEQLRYVSEVARYGSFNQAATVLYMSQPALSAAVKKLEQEMGESIFIRHNTGVTLTPFGSELLPYLRNVLGLLDQMPNQLYGKGHKNRPRLSVCNGGYRYIAAAVAKVYEAHREEGVHIDYYDVTREEALPMVASGTADVAGYGFWNFQKQHLLRRMEDMDLQFFPTAIARPTVAVGPKNPLYTREEDWVTLDMIRDYPVLYTFSEHASSLHKRLGISPGRNVVTCKTRMGRCELLENTEIDTDDLIVEFRCMTVQIGD